MDGCMIIIQELQKISEEFEESIKQRVKDVFDKRQMRHNKAAKVN